MMAAVSPVPLDEFVTELAARHNACLTPKGTGPTGRQMRRRLEVRIDHLVERAGDLPSSMHADLIGLDWLVENQHVIREAIDQVGGNLPRGYIRKLPAIVESPDTAKPRARALAETIIEVGVLPIDIAWIEGFLADYQTKSPLTLGELWAFPAFLRVVVIDELCEALGQGLELAASGSRKARFSEIASALSGAVLSLRTIAANDWREFVEHQSTVERILTDDPSGDYPQMDAESRNRYRERVEILARRFTEFEWIVAENAIAVAREAADTADARDRHVGFYLIDQGIARLELALRSKPSLRSRLARLKAGTSWVYVTTIGAVSVSSLVLINGILSLPQLGSAARWLLVGLLAVPVLTIWTEIVNWLITQIVPPRVLPKLDFSESIPDKNETIVAVPCMLTNTAEIDRLIQSLEINYLGNDDPRLYYALLSDYVDADREETDKDSSLLDYALASIEALNARYVESSVRPFALFHRRRVWNDNAAIWMGWERKRGKIEEFNRWLLGADDTTFTVVHGDIQSMRGARFVIVLDADNQLLPGAAAKLVGTLSHPLNRPQFDAHTGRVVAGYTVVQPRVDVHPASANRTLFSRLMAGETGIDLYQQAISETYQDLFGRGIYSGKGIYDVRAFARSVEGRIPTNAVLSHDLLEGILGRAGFASDIVLLESASPNLLAELKRQHRWIRGDWQLFPWLIPIGATMAQWQGIDLLGRWKLFDNLRRSLVTPSLLLLFLAGWILLPEHRGSWTLAIALVPGLRIIYSFLGDLRWSAHRWGTLRSTAIRLTGNFGRQAGQYLINLANLPIVAATVLDAIARTVTRMTVTRRNLLQWTPSEQSARAAVGQGVVASYRQGVVAPFIGIIALSIAARGDRWALLPALFGTTWCIAPWLSWLMAREREEPARLSINDRLELRKLARRTWQFYERFVGPETHWLPPDNYQEAPKLALAERTSPTNIGLFLLAAVAAHDLGYMGISGLLTRIDGTTATIRRMQRFRGHLFNWYSTRDLSVLPPDYVSTVDSGNLIAALLVCRTALEKLEQSPLAHVRAEAALLDLVANITDTVKGTHDTGAGDMTAILAVLEKTRQKIVDTAPGVEAWIETVNVIHDSLCAELDDAILTVAETGNVFWSASRIEELRSWLIQLRSEAEILQAELANTRQYCRATEPYNDIDRRDDTAGSSTPQTLAQIIERVDEASVEARRHAQDPAAASAASADSQALAHAARILGDFVALRDRVVTRIDEIVAMTDFSFLFDRTRKLFHIGYNNTTGELDPSYYDLLASEARIASIVAIAKGDIPVAHWVHLGRPLRRIGGMRVVLSWSATAFEYLMPVLFMASPSHGLLDVSCRAIIREQRRLTRHSRVPWGISESAYFELDSTGHYKYFAFGVDSLAMRRSMRQRYVVSPYASMLALPFEPRRVVHNLQRLRELGCWGRYGLYEALDFGEDHTAKSKPRIVQSFMAHHQAMILAAIANALCSDSLVQRFHANPTIGAVEHLLYESLPKRAQDRIIKHTPPVRQRVVPVMTAEHVNIAPYRHARFVNVVGNGHLTVRTTGRGSGDITWNERAITRWQPRTQGPEGGDRIYLSDSASDAIHIIGVPEGSREAAPELWCAPFQTELHQRFGPLRARLTIGVAPDNDVVIKRVTITNESAKRRTTTLTHYAELVLAHTAEDQRHPAFNKLFIERKYRNEDEALLFTRRPRSADEAGLSCAVAAVAADEFNPALSFESDRRAFLGRNCSYYRPAALAGKQTDQADSSPDSLDPIAAITVTLDIPAGATAQVAFLISVSPDRIQALELIGHLRSFERISFSLDQARRRAAAQLTELSVNSDDVMGLLAVYADMIWPKPLATKVLAELSLTHSILSALWSRGISGDYPIGMACSRRHTDSDFAEQLLVLQSYLGQRGVAIDVVLADESSTSYAEPVRNRLEQLVNKYRRPHRRGRAFVLTMNTLSSSERTAIDVAAVVRFESNAAGTMGMRERRLERYRDVPDFVPTRSAEAATAGAVGARSATGLEFDNGYGGIDAKTGAYVIRVTPSAPTPAPWINVLANSEFGSIVSERGAATTWFGNSSEHRLSSWYNDPTSDRAGEALYLRDEETGEFWSPTPWPIPGSERYTARHEAGCTKFEHSSHEIEQHVECFVDRQYPVKCIRVRMRNLAQRPRRFTLTYFVEWVLGNHYEDTSPFIFPDISADRSILLARNLLPRFGHERVAFVTSSAPLHGFTTDRREFLGDARDPSRPAALQRLGLSGDIAACAEPCCAYQIHVDLESEQQTDVCFTLGAERDRNSALELAADFRALDYVNERFEATRRHWHELLTQCRIRTPNRALDCLFNHWLLYQNLACRVWGRTGLYQAAGGFGFRDQLQDCLALVHVRPDLARAQILKACRVQFGEGDVLHWWHETPLRGVRSRCSDDLLWLPYAVSEYARITGDLDVLDAQVPYLAGEPLREDEDDRYAEYSPSERSASLYEHCRRAIDARAATGVHGLPLIGTGDWNDGFNRVGIAGRGESVWLAWFLADVYIRFAEIAESRGDGPISLEFRRRRDALVDSLERHAWDQDWYLRGYYDDGSTLGAAADTECQIDLNAQTWPVITGLTTAERGRRALTAAAERLVDDPNRLIKLLAPPFDRTLKDPGYIKGYPPGVRENGGQYTHAATWAVWAAVKLGRPEQAMHWVDLLNPLLRVTDKPAADRYLGEPYVLAGDIYGVSPRTGQAGWTWYTGSAAWLYRIVLEQVLGFQPRAGELRVRPCVPHSWPNFDIDYRVGESNYAISVVDPAEIAKSGARYEVDGKSVMAVRLLDDGEDHRVVVSPSESESA